MKVEQASSPQTSKSAVGVIPKASMFGAKFGFVIPKNKLSGSLVPAFRSASKSGNFDPVTDVNKEQAVRKTKWGPDLTQDAFVRKARLLAYQTRVDQITQQIETKDPETEVGQYSDKESLNTNQGSSHHELDAKELEKLKLEKREIIGEILKLKPSYKPPLDYVPLLKEARVPLPTKDYPGYNFLGLIYGSGSDTLKRLEKETGAKIQVFGNKRDSVEKVEITSEDKKNQDDYSELYALVSADTYDKVDAAVALVELLVTPVSASSSTLPASDAPIHGQSSEAPSEVPNTAGVVQPLVRPTQIFQGQFQYVSPAAEPSNPAQLLSSQSNPGSMVPAVNTGPPIPGPSPFPSVLQQPHMQFPMQPSQTFGQTDPPRYPPVVAPHTLPSQSNLSNVHQFSGSQPTPMRIPSMARPLGTPWPQSAPDYPIRSQLSQDGSSTRWSGPQGPTPNSSMAGITHVPVQGHQNTAFGMAQTPSFHSRPSTFLLPGNVNQAPLQVRSYPASTQGPSAAAIPTHSLPNLAMQPPLMRGPVAPQNPAYRPGAVPFPGPSASLPPLHHSRMPFQNSGDFGSQHLQNSAAQMNPWPGSNVQNNPPLKPTMQRPLDIRAPSFLPDFPNQPHPPFFRSNFGSHAGDHRFQPQPQPHFRERSPSDVLSRPTFQLFPHQNFGMRDAPLSHMGEMIFNRFHQRESMQDSFSSRPVYDYVPRARTDRNPPRQTYMHSRGHLAYDPFSPTTVPAAHHLPQVSSTNPKAAIVQEKNIPENEDKTASAGVK